MVCCILHVIICHVVIGHVIIGYVIIGHVIIGHVICYVVCLDVPDVVKDIRQDKLDFVKKKKNLLGKSREEQVSG